MAVEKKISKPEKGTPFQKSDGLRNKITQTPPPKKPQASVPITKKGVK